VAAPSSNQYFTASFMIEVNEVRNRHLKLEHQAIVGLRGHLVFLLGRLAPSG